MSASPLFRPEVVQAQANQWLGSIRIGRPFSFSVVTVAALLMAIGLVSFAVWGEASRKVSLPGVLVPEGGLIDLRSSQHATVAELLVKEGDSVRAGQPLIQLRSDRILKGGELARLQQAALEQRRASLQNELRLLDEQFQQRTNALRDRLRSLELDLSNLHGELEASLQRVKLGAHTADRYRDLAASGYVSGLQAQQRQEELLDLEQRERNSRRNLEATQREVTGVRSELETLRPQHKTQREHVQRQLAQLDQEARELDGRTAWSIAAPEASVVSALNVKLGQSVHPASTVVSLVPQGHSAASGVVLLAHLYAPSRTIGFIKAGQQVWLRLAAFPYQKFGMQQGTVYAVTQTPINPDDLPVGQAQGLMHRVGVNEPLYRVTVQLRRQDVLAAGKKFEPKSGMTVEALIVQDSRSIFEWLFEPILALRLL